MDTDRKAKAPSEITIKAAKNKGFIVRHAFDNYGSGESYRPPEEHAFSTHAQMLTHVHKHTGGAVAEEKAPTGVGKKLAHAAPTARSAGAGAD